MKVSDEQRTSSPASTPEQTSATCSAEVPFTTATACLAPSRSAVVFSNRVTYSPTEETQPVSRQSLTYSQALPPILGTHNGTTSSGVGAPGSNDVDTGSVPLQMFAHPLDRLGE